MLLFSLGGGVQSNSLLLALVTTYYSLVLIAYNNMCSFAVIFGVKNVRRGCLDALSCAHPSFIHFLRSDLCPFWGDIYTFIRSGIILNNILQRWQLRTPIDIVQCPILNNTTIAAMAPRLYDVLTVSNGQVADY